MENKYQITLSTIGEEDLTDNPWLVNILKNKLKQVFMTPSLVIIPGKSDNLVDRIVDVFKDPGHDCKLIRGITGGFIELLVDNKYLIHLIFLTNRKDPNSSRITVILTKLEISPIANSDTSEPKLDENLQI